MRVSIIDNVPLNIRRISKQISEKLTRFCGKIFFLVKCLYSPLFEGLDVNEIMNLCINIGGEVISTDKVGNSKMVNVSDEEEHDSYLTRNPFCITRFRRHHRPGKTDLPSFVKERERERRREEEEEEERLGIALETRSSSSSSFASYLEKGVIPRLTMPSDRTNVDELIYCRVNRP